MKVSVVTPNYNGIKFLNTYFETLSFQSKHIEEIIIIDNASQDGSYELIEEYVSSPDYPIPIKLIKNDENLGFAPAVNQGIEIAKSEYIFSLNNDVELESDVVENLVETMDRLIENNKNPFSVASKMVQYHNKKLIDDCGDEYTLLGWCKKAGDNQSIEKYTEEREIFSSCAGACLYRKSILNKIGYFDESFFAYVEDIDLSYRALINGYKNFFSPNAIVYHYGSGTSGSRYNEFKIKLAARNNIWLVYKNQPIPQKILNFIFLFLGFLLKYLFFYRKGYGSIYLSGLKEGLNTKNKIKKTKFKKENWKNYFKIEWKLIKNTINFLRL